MYSINVSTVEIPVQKGKTYQVHQTQSLLDFDVVKQSSNQRIEKIAGGSGRIYKVLGSSRHLGAPLGSKS
jgi:hypothetical protein